MPENKNPSLFSGDQPLVDPADDKLDRDRFSGEIADSLGRWKGHDSLVVSLTGEWGSGKSTIKNFVIHHLARQRPEPTTVEFNPWEWSGQDKLAEGFLWQLGAVFGKKNIAKQTKRLAAKWKAFASVIQLAGEVSHSTHRVVLALLPFLLSLSLLEYLKVKAPSFIWVAAVAFVISAALPLIGGILEKLAVALSDLADAHAKSLEELRSDIEKELRKLNAPIIVFIDDVDRLTKEEIKLLFQLVKANLRFPNLVYVLLFQKNIIENALQEITADFGTEYLRKIVQVEFDIPQASSRQMQNMLASGLEHIMNREGITFRWDGARWQSIFLDSLWPYFKNLRDIKRFLGSFGFYFTLHLNQGVLEVNPVDLIAVEVLRMFEHDAFVGISKSFFAQRTFGPLDGSEDVAKAFSKQINDIVSRASNQPQDQEPLKHLLQALFPQSRSQDISSEWKRDFRICDDMAFYKYFQLTLDSTKPTAQEVTRFVRDTGDRDLLVELLRDAINRNTIQDFLECIFASREELPIDHMQMVASALFDVGDELPERTKSMFSAGLDMDCIRIIYHRLKGAPQSKSTELLWQAYNATMGFILPIRNLALEDQNTRDKGNKDEFLISADKLDQFTSLTLDRIRAKAADKSLLDHKDCGYVLYRWQEWSKTDEVKEWLNKIIEDRVDAVKLLARLMSDITVNGVRKVPRLPGKALELLINLDSLHSAIQRIPHSQLSERDIINIQLLSKAVKLKAEGKGYDEVRPDGSRY